jgi:hypothetical protein
MLVPALVSPRALCERRRSVFRGLQPAFDYGRAAHETLLDANGAIEALTRAGQTIPEKLDEARLLFERMLEYANHLGLYAEQIGPQGETLGNFPQAFTHLAMISAAFNLDRALGGRD